MMKKSGTLLETAYRKGCRFDGWGEILRFDLWQEAMSEAGIDPENYLRERNTNEILPWDNIDCGVSREFLLQERNKSSESAATEDCRYSDCQNCGVCDFTTTKNIFSEAPQLTDIVTSTAAIPAVEPRIPRNTIPLCSEKYIALLLPNLTAPGFYPIWNCPWL